MGNYKVAREKWHSPQKAHSLSHYSYTTSTPADNIEVLVVMMIAIVVTSYMIKVLLVWFFWNVFTTILSVYLFRIQCYSVFVFSSSSHCLVLYLNNLKIGSSEGHFSHMINLATRCVIQGPNLSTWVSGHEVCCNPFTIWYSMVWSQER